MLEGALANGTNLREAKPQGKITRRRLRMQQYTGMCGVVYTYVYTRTIKAQIYNIHTLYVCTEKITTERGKI